jgi:hypothetical protein
MKSNSFDYNPCHDQYSAELLTDGTKRRFLVLVLKLVSLRELSI